MYGTGMRVSEALHLRACHIDSQRMMIRIEQSKGNRDRDVLLSPKLVQLLRTYWRKLPPQEWLFPGQDPHQPLSREAVGQAVTQASRRAGLTKKPSPHCLRHAFAVRLLEAGTDRKDASTGFLTRIVTEHPSSSTERKERISRLPRSATMPAKEPVSCQVELTPWFAPLGSTETRLWLSGHAASIYSVNRGESDAGPWHPETRSTKESVSFLRLSTITLIRSSIR